MVMPKDGPPKDCKTLSVTCGDTSPKGRGLGKEMQSAWTAKGSHFGGAGIAQR